MHKIVFFSAFGKKFSLWTFKTVNYVRNVCIFNKNFFKTDTYNYNLQNTSLIFGTEYYPCVYFAFQPSEGLQWNLIRERFIIFSSITSNLFCWENEKTFRKSLKNFTGGMFYHKLGNSYELFFWPEEHGEIQIEM